MNIPVIEALAMGRATLVRNGTSKPYVAHVAPGRAKQLKAEMLALGVHFGIPLFVEVPDPKEDGEWTYLGLLLCDVHVFERIVAT